MDRQHLPESLGMKQSFKAWQSSLLGGSESGIALIDEGQANTVALGELDERLLALADDENVGQTRGEGVALGVLDVDDLVGTRVVLNVHEGARSADIVSAGDEDSGSVFEFNNAVDLASLQVKLGGTSKY